MSIQYSVLILVVEHFKRSYKNKSRVSNSKVWFLEKMTKNSFNTFCYSVQYLKNRLNNEIVNLNYKVMFEE